MCFCFANQVYVAACICFFLRNPFAFANVPLLPTGFCFRLQVRFLFPLASQVSVSAWSQVSVSAGKSGFCFRRQVRFLFPLAGQISVSAWSQVSVSTCRPGLRRSCRCRQPQPAAARAAPLFNQFSNQTTIFFKYRKR
ncbi:hypothetical protein [Methanimicrococcus hongohii]|uniref:hypothetical protein n=1 Tax=Methanimicrococcus hongohii TaxID=3028295 RepID=UPI00292FD62D|nr:hypothetical protein [Methanimicrococcus sp. Hf6]